MILLSAPRRPPNSLLRVFRVISGSTLASFEEWGEEQNTNLSIKHNLFSHQFCLRGHTRNTEETFFCFFFKLLVATKPPFTLPFELSPCLKLGTKIPIITTITNRSCFSKSRLNLLYKKNILNIAIYFYLIEMYNAYILYPYFKGLRVRLGSV